MGLVGRVWGNWCKRALLGLWLGAVAMSACAAAEPIQAGKAEASKPAATATAGTSAGKGKPAGPAASAWPHLTHAEFAACGREMRLFRGYVHALRDADLREQCKGGGQETETCDAAGLNCKKGNTCTEARRLASTDEAGPDVDWYLRGNSLCEASRYPCWGDTVVNTDPQTDGDRQAWLDGQNDAAAIPYELAKLQPAPARLETAQDLPEGAFSQVEAALRACLAKTWLAKYRAQNKATAGPAQPAAAVSNADAQAYAVNAAHAANAVGVVSVGKGAAVLAAAPAAAVPAVLGPAPVAVPPAAPVATAAQPLAAEAAPPPMTGLQCQAEILKIHREARAAVQAVPNPVAMRAVNGEMARRQKQLFATRCAQQPDAIEYLAAADRLLAANAAQAAAPAAPGGLLGAGAPVGEVPVGAMVATSAAPANECLRLLETGLYGGFINKCAYKVNVAYCVSNPKKGGWTDTDAFRCLSPTNTRPGNAHLSLAASKTEVQHTLGGDAVLWLACKDPAVPVQTRFDAGRMLGTCKDR